jgi:uncharacterized coiled-coil protein SlyX
MTKSTDQATQIENLEIKIMDLEVSLQQLNEVVLRQYRDIEQLRKTVDQLETKLDSGVEDGPRPNAADEVPPHY